MDYEFRAIFSNPSDKFLNEIADMFGSLPNTEMKFIVTESRKAGRDIFTYLTSTARRWDRLPSNKYNVYINVQSNGRCIIAYNGTYFMGGPKSKDPFTRILTGKFGDDTTGVDHVRDCATYAISSNEGEPLWSVSIAAPNISCGTVSSNTSAINPIRESVQCVVARDSSGDVVWAASGVSSLTSDVVYETTSSCSVSTCSPIDALYGNYLGNANVRSALLYGG